MLEKANKPFLSWQPGGMFWKASGKLEHATGDDSGIPWLCSHWRPAFLPTNDPWQYPCAPKDYLHCRSCMRVSGLVSSLTPSPCENMRSLQGVVIFRFLVPSLRKVLGSAWQGDTWHLGRPAGCMGTAAAAAGLNFGRLRSHGSGSNQGDPILVGSCTTHSRTYFSGDWDVRWGYGLLAHGHIFKYSARLSGGQLLKLSARKCAGEAKPERPEGR